MSKMDINFVVDHNILLPGRSDHRKLAILFAGRGKGIIFQTVRFAATILKGHLCFVTSLCSIWCLLDRQTHHWKWGSPTTRTYCSTAYQLAGGETHPLKEGDLSNIQWCICIAACVTSDWHHIGKTLWYLDKNSFIQARFFHSFTEIPEHCPDMITSLLGHRAETWEHCWMPAGPPPSSY